jgi:UDP-N-acetylmuramoyl-tripeptide--D-alanyl-D-alanine ligase
MTQQTLRLTPGLVAELLGLELPDPAIASAPLTRAISDTREAKGGEMFVALPGEHGDGHAWVADAFERGAGLALVSSIPEGLPAEYRSRVLQVASPLKALQVLARTWRARFDIPVIGITGSVGKTTTKEVVSEVLAARFRVLRSAKSFNNEIGLPLTLCGLDSRHEVAVLEMGMSGIGEIAQLCAIARPTHGVVTVIGESHLEFLGTRDNIALAKRELVEALPVEGLAVLNQDDPRVHAMARFTPARVRTFGTQETAHLHITDLVTRGLEGISMTVHWRDRSYPITSPLVGVHNAVSIAAGIILGLELGMPLGEIADAVSKVKTEIRQRIIKGADGVTVIDDSYNAAPRSVLAALDVLRDAPGRKVAVLGDMFELGSAEESGHREVGERAAAVADVLVAVGRRSAFTAEAARAAGMDAVVHVETGDEAVAAVRDVVRSGDTVLVKGSRAMRMERVVEALR